MIRQVCDICTNEIQPYASPYFEAQIGEHKAIVTISSENIRDGLGWRLEPCKDCLMKFIIAGKWVENGKL